MQQGTLVVQQAIDPIALFVVAIILFNIISSIARGIKKATARASSTDEQAQQRLAQSLQPTPAPDLIAARRAAEIAKLRKALLASAGLPDDDAQTAQPATYTATTQPQYQAPPAVQPQYQTQTQTTMRPRYQAPPIVRSPLSRTRAVQMPAVSPAPAAPPSPALLPDEWSLQSPHLLLMSLESATTAFDRLATAGSAEAALQSTAALAAAAPQRLAMLQGAGSGANLFVAAAIVGPCAAFRSIGHTPGGW
ncbi:MAG TPA: hypothetical protein VGQ96_05790 [Candidatus Eremiobacteraceae bacterium]|nr:hypothetical protein [Candidatus Eremiobacteraceae bacterium]